ncbi:GtrA family protein [Marilutibacter chinensis]|uniref:GtrA family protein n=1 Tax=Marilutibacter chinensis TaxID=2912247 RepID=A0ABS9HUE7_9GAMM|nr:GtrA family protein [Lysobacter chinensis]MCF7222308.1 GtrA family protein [Lysobacter chinensis]
MSVLRQGKYFLLVGVLQVLLDWAVFVGLSALGAGPSASNVGGRVSGACLGFWLNGRITFAKDGQARLGGGRLLRFLFAWTFLTCVSTWAMTSLATGPGLGWAWLTKPLVEALLALLSFFASRHWIYR